MISLTNSVITLILILIQMNHFSIQKSGSFFILTSIAQNFVVVAKLINFSIKKWIELISLDLKFVKDDYRLSNRLDKLNDKVKTLALNFQVHLHSTKQ